MRAKPPKNPPKDTEPISEPLTFSNDQLVELYGAERKAVIEGARTTYDRFDQTAVGLSGGAIVLSVTFLKEISRGSEFLPLLFFAWGLLLLAILCGFISLRTSGGHSEEKLKQLDCRAVTGTCDESKMNRLTQLTSTLNWAVLCLCVAGIAAMLIFATATLLSGGK